MMLNQTNCSQPSINFTGPNPMKLVQQRGSSPEASSRFTRSGRSYMTRRFVVGDGVGGGSEGSEGTEGTNGVSRGEMVNGD